jgi:hypothetical protein
MTANRDSPDHARLGRLFPKDGPGKADAGYGEQGSVSFLSTALDNMAQNNQGETRFAAYFRGRGCLPREAGSL